MKSGAFIDIVKDLQEDKHANYGNLGRNGKNSFLEWLQSIINGKKGQISGSDQDQDILSYLQSLLVNSSEMTDDQRNDWNKQILEQIINYNLTSENRQYNESLRDEQRLYDSPTNMLARLMGAGISRDAAIQMLSGGAGSGGSGVPFSDPAAAAQGIAPSQSRLNGAQADTAVANAVFNGISAVSGLVNLGLSAPVAIRQAQFLNGQNYLQTSQINAYKTAGAAFDILNTAGAAADAFSSTAGAVQSIQQLAADGNVQAKQFVDSGGIQTMQNNSPFVSPVLASMYRSERASGDYARMYTATMRKYDAENSLAELQYSALTQEIINSQAMHEQIVANTDYLKAMEITCKALGLNYQASTNLLISQTTSQDLLNQATRSLYGSSYDGKSYLDWRNDEILSNLVTNARIAAKTTNPEYAESVYKQMFNTSQSVAAAMSLQALKDQAGLEFSSKYPQQFAFWQGLEKSGAYDYLENVVRAKTSASGGNQIWSGTRDLPAASDIVDPDTYQPSWLQRILNANHKE